MTTTRREFQSKSNVIITSWSGSPDSYNLVICHDSGHPDFQEVVYDSIANPSGGITLDQIAKELKIRKIEMPGALLFDLAMDEINDRGDKEHFYGRVN